jgi:hypothetical protein
MPGLNMLAAGGAPSGRDTSVPSDAAAATAGVSAVLVSWTAAGALTAAGASAGVAARQPGAALLSAAAASPPESPAADCGELRTSLPALLQWGLSPLPLPPLPLLPAASLPPLLVLPPLPLRPAASPLLPPPAVSPDDRLSVLARL